MRARAGSSKCTPVRISVTGFVPGERVQAMLCAAPYTHGSERCGAPGPVAPFTIDADGTGRVAMVVKGGRVGSDGSLVRSERAVRDRRVVPAFLRTRNRVPHRVRGRTVGTLRRALDCSPDSPPPSCSSCSPTYLVRTTDWRKPSEADTPDLDRAVLTD